MERCGRDLTWGDRRQHGKGRTQDEAMLVALLRGVLLDEHRALVRVKRRVGAPPMNEFSMLGANKVLFRKAMEELKSVAADQQPRNYACDPTQQRRKAVAEAAQPHARSPFLSFFVNRNGRRSDNTEIESDSASISRYGPDCLGAILIAVLDAKTESAAKGDEDLRLGPPITTSTQQTYKHAPCLHDQLRASMNFMTP